MKEEKGKVANAAKWPWETPAPVVPRWFAKPVPVEIPAEVRIYRFYEEAVAHITDGGLDKFVTVPLFAVDEERQIVKGALVAEAGDGSAILVYFAPTCLGTDRLVVEHSIAAKWANQANKRKESNAAV